MAAEVKADPEAGLVGADGDNGNWMDEFLNSDIALGEDLDLGVLDYSPPAAIWTPSDAPAVPWTSSDTSPVAPWRPSDESGLADSASTPEETLWTLDNGTLGSMLLANPQELEGRFVSEVQVESQESNKTAEYSQGDSSKAEPACSSRAMPAGGVKKEKESDSDSDNNRSKVEQEDIEKLQERLMRNRESAQLSRQRKKAYMEEMAVRIRTLSSTVAELNSTIAHLHAENASLRHQLAFYLPPGTAPPLPAVGPPYAPHIAPGMRPIYPAPVPIGYGPYSGAMRPGYVPPVPIPRLPVQSTASTKKAPAKRGPATKAKAKDGPKEPAKKRRKLPAKAAAGISAMALFCFAMVIAPASWHAADLSASLAVQPVGDFGQGVLKTGGRVLMSLPEGNQSVQVDGGRKKAQVDERDARSGELVNSSLVWQQLVNASSPPPEQEQSEWVEIKQGPKESQKSSFLSGVFRRQGDMGWIKGAVIAEAQKAAQRIVSDVTLGKGSEESRLALMTGSEDHERLKGIATLALAGHAETKRQLETKSNALLPASDTVGFSDQSTDDMWTFNTHPFLSSGMCTELFHFVDPVVADGFSDKNARAAAEEAALTVARSLEDAKVKGTDKANQTTGLRGMGRKWQPKNPDAVPMPPVGGNVSHFDVAPVFGANKGPETCEEGAYGCKNKSSTVVVSVMVPPVGWERAAYGGKKGASAASKGLSQIFVVVLINSAKYVTYSCSVPAAA